MALSSDSDVKGKVKLPRLLRLSSAFALRYPFTSVLLLVLQAGSGVVLLSHTSLPSAWVNCAVIGMIVLCLLLLMNSALRIWSGGLLGDLVDFVAESGSRPCFKWTNREVLVGIIPFVVLGALPFLCYYLEVRQHMESLGEVDKQVIYGVVTFTTVDGPFLSVTVFTGCVQLVRLVASLLKAALRKHFDNLEVALTTQGNSTEEKVKELDGHCKRVLRIFEKANKCITRQIFAAVVLANMAALITIIQLVTTLRGGKLTPFLFCFLGGLSLVGSVTGVALLHSMTTVADEYEDLAAKFSLNIALRFRLTNTFPGPPGVKLMTSFEKDHVNDLSFNFHHRPLNASVLEGTLIRLFMGALVSVCLGILT
mmetsp:Transcript_10291/g.24228  ORF Transcript_10291/g.24228 Transcript_10291/m.24228 type:complete len:367 (+) Transcript_10291:132-1232(+)